VASSRRALSGGSLDADNRQDREPFTAGPSRISANRRSGEERIYAPHGSFVALSSAFFERRGSLDTSLPLYAEELSLAATAERLRLPVWHRRDLEVLHRSHSTLGAGITREKYQMERAARSYYYRLAGAPDR
jgi:hypothetical protein